MLKESHWTGNTSEDKSLSEGSKKKKNTVSLEALCVKLCVPVVFPFFQAAKGCKHNIFFISVLSANSPLRGKNTSIVFYTAENSA